MDFVAHGRGRVCLFCKEFMNCYFRSSFYTLLATACLKVYLLDGLAESVQVCFCIYL